MRSIDYATKEVVSIRAGSPIADAASLMEEQRFRHVPVVINGQLVGMISDRDIALHEDRTPDGNGQRPTPDKRPISGCRSVDQIMSQPVITLLPHDPVQLAARTMVARRVSALPLVRAGRLAGIITESDLLKGLQRRAVTCRRVQRFLRRHIDELMATDVVTVEPHSSLVQVLTLLKQKTERHVIVAKDETVLGIISDRVIRHTIRKCLSGKLDAVTLTAKEMMSTSICTIEHDATVSQTIDTFLLIGVRALPVIQEEWVEGMITTTDLVRAIGEQDLLQLARSYRGGRQASIDCRVGTA